MADQGTKKCAHAGCNCMAKGDDKYCGPLCKDSGDTLDIACNCGHSECRIKA